MEKKEIEESVRRITDLIRDKGNAAQTEEIVRILEGDANLREYLSTQTKFHRADSPLHAASSENAPDIMKLLIEDYNLQLDSRQESHNIHYFFFSRTPLHRAISHTNVEAVKMLLEYGADPELGGIEDGEEFQNALQLAKRSGGKTIVDILRNWKPGEKPL